MKSQKKYLPLNTPKYPIIISQYVPLTSHIVSVVHPISDIHDIPFTCHNISWTHGKYMSLHEYLSRCFHGFLPCLQRSNPGGGCWFNGRRLGIDQAALLGTFAARQVDQVQLALRPIRAGWWMDGFLWTGKSIYKKMDDFSGHPDFQDIFIWMWRYWKICWRMLDINHSSMYQPLED